MQEDLWVDSLTAIELAMVLEDEFDISLPEEVVAACAPTATCSKLVSERVAAAAVGGE